MRRLVPRAAHPRGSQQLHTPGARLQARPRIRRLNSHNKWIQASFIASSQGRRKQ
jgi:hypothetical protein